jgi:hypothetical protein
MMVNLLRIARFERLAGSTGVNLTVKLTEIPRPAVPAAFRPAVAQPLAICDRCGDAEEIVIALMEIIALGETWVLCGSCAHELPRGFTVV